LILDAGSVITAAIGSIGEPREWSVKQKYQQTYLGPKRARQWQRIREADVNGDTTNAERVAHFLGVTHEAAGSLLRDAEREGKAERVSRGRYKVAR
jgi:predicted transcriptional regulator of viral defense system